MLEQRTAGAIPGSSRAGVSTPIINYKQRPRTVPPTWVQACQAMRIPDLAKSRG
jgi:hypothetical protein